MIPAPATRRERRRRCTALLLSLFVSLLLISPVHGETSDPPPAEANAEEPPTPPGDTDAADADEPQSDAPPLPVLVVDEVTITASRSERSVLDVPGNVTVIDRETIDRSGVRHVPELLRREAGIFVTNTTTNPEGYTVEGRGFNNGGGNGSGMLVMLDGRRLNEPTTGVADWALIPLDQVERIEVVRGPASAAYGDHAMAGVIHIISRSGEDGLRAIARGETGTYDTDAGSLYVGGSEGPISASLFIDGDKTHGYRERSDFRSHQASADFQYRIGDRATLGLTGGYTSQVRQRPGVLTKEEMHEDRRQAEAGGGGKNFDNARERFLQGLVEISIAEGLSVRLVPYYRHRKDRGALSNPFFSYSTGSETDVLGLTSQIQFDTTLFGHANRLIVGGDLMQEDSDFDSNSRYEYSFPLGGAEYLMRGSDSTRSRSRRKSYGIFLQNELNLTNDLLLSLGVRRDRARYRGDYRYASTIVEEIPLWAWSSTTSQNTERKFEPRHAAWAPRAALTYRIVEPLSVYASYSRGFRFPNLDEAFGSFGASPALDTQKSDSYEVGLKVRTSCLSLNAAAFYMNVHEEMIWNPSAPNPFSGLLGRNVNLDRVRHRGIELSSTVQVTNWLEVYGSFTYDDTKITRDKVTYLEGNKMPITPRYRGTAGVRVQLCCGFEAGINANYVGARYGANDLRNELEKLPKFASYDARLGWRHQIGEHLEILFEASALNFTNRRYTEFGGGRTFFNPSAPQEMLYFPSPDRHYVAGVQLVVKQ
jgi:iron complex outermembrane receptor protein